MAVADKVGTVLTWSLQLRYQMLDRMRQDCEYFLGCGNRVTKYLWAGNVADHTQQRRHGIAADQHNDRGCVLPAGRL